MRTVYIIGGGITGCSLSYFLKQKFNVILFEKKSYLGGLTKTFYNMENIPYQKGAHILHTNKQWIIDLINSHLEQPISPIQYTVAIDPLIDFQYYEFPFTLQSLKRMPWHWKESINLELEKINGSIGNSLKEIIINFYGETIYTIFYKEYIKKWFGKSADDIDSISWYRYFLRSLQYSSGYYIESTYFPINQGWNVLFDGLTSGVEVHLNEEKTYSDFNSDDLIILTGRLDTFFNTHIPYIENSFDIDSVLYSENKPDMIIYPNYVPFLSMTQFGKFFTNHDKNIIIKESIDGNEECYPIPTIKNYKKVKKIKNSYSNVYYAGWAANYAFLDIATSIEQSSKIAAQIKHKHI